MLCCSIFELTPGGSMGSTTITELITFIFSLLSQTAEFFS